MLQKSLNLLISSPSKNTKKNDKVIEIGRPIHSIKSLRFRPKTEQKSKLTNPSIILFQFLNFEKNAFAFCASCQVSRDKGREREMPRIMRATSKAWLKLFQLIGFRFNGRKYHQVSLHDEEKVLTVTDEGETY